jgi:hypothetical protein
MAVLMNSSGAGAVLERWLGPLDRWWEARSSPARGRVELGDFGRHLPPLEPDEVSVYDALVRRFLHPRLAMLSGSGLVLGVDRESRWADVLPAPAEVEVPGASGPSERELAAVASMDWVVLDRCLQRLSEMAGALEEVVGRLRPDARLVTLFTGIARAEPIERAPFWTVTPYAARRLHEERRKLERVEVEQHGNVSLALAWLYRLPADGLTEQELATVDPAYPLLVGVTASRWGRRA